MRRERGFTLLEVMVALVIAGLALGVMFDAAAVGLRASQRAARTAEALSLARSRLAALGHGAALVAADTQGDDGAYHWRQRVELMAALPRPRGAVRLYAVRVALSGPEDGAVHAVELADRRLGLGER